MTYSDIPRIVTKFFELEQDAECFDQFDIINMPWLELDSKYTHGDRLVSLIEEKIEPHSRYFDPRMSRGVDVFDIFGATDKEKYRDYRKNDSTHLLNTLQYRVRDELSGERAVTDLLQLIPYKKVYEVYVNAIRPGGYLYPHIDNKKILYGKHREGLKDQIAIHLTNPEGYKFGFRGHGEVPKQIGVPTCLNTNKYMHCVMNNSNQTRYLVHMHGEHSTGLDQLMVESFTKRLA
jgi:hypothetical protein